MVTLDLVLERNVLVVQSVRGAGESLLRKVGLVGLLAEIDLRLPGGLRVLASDGGAGAPGAGGLCKGRAASDRNGEDRQGKAAAPQR